MKDIVEKLETLRTAIAMATIKASAGAIEKIRTGTVPKGDVLEVARVAGILSAKKTSELIPYCHQIPLDWVMVVFELNDNRIVIESRVKAIWKTGVEMEALTAASVAALTIYDMLKPLDDDLEIMSIKLVEKHGGKSEWKEDLAHPLKAAVLVISDSVSQGNREDKSGKFIMEKLGTGPVEVAEYKVLPDDYDLIINELITLSDRDSLDLILTTGGTGIGPRDLTVEATKNVVEREIPGISEAMRSYGFQRTPYAMLSRGIAGVRGKTIIINLPGSSKGVAEGIDALFPWILHSFTILEGGGHDTKE